MALEGSIALVGGGNMGAALITGLLNSKTAQPSQVTVAEKDPQRAEKLRQDLKVNTVAAAGDLTPQDVLILAVKPADIGAAAQEAAPALGPQTLVISVAAGVTLATLAGLLPKGQPLVRVMPNTPALAGKAMTSMAKGPQVTDQQLKVATGIFAAVGMVAVLEEKLMNAATALAGSGPAYVFMFIEALADGAVNMGLDRGTALTMAVQTVAGAAEMMLRSGQHPALLKDLVSSPGGTTIAAIRALESRGFRGSVIEAIAAATARGDELSKK